jgi:hypothetical protein
MSDAFDAPSTPSTASAPRDPVLGMSTDGLLTIAMAELIVVGGLCGVLMALTGVMTVASLVVDIPTSPGDPPMYVIAPIEFVVMTIPTVLYLGGAVGLHLRAKWGWVLALIGFGLWMGGCCMPFGAIGFYALLREDGRKAFGFGA